MSKIAEQKALEAYPIIFSERNGYDNTFKDRRESYIKGYNQAEKDFTEKACEWLENNVRVNGAFYCFVFKKDDIEKFRQAMMED